ncbi:MAG: YifB family Mg chelatase-like AAA ATPase, partial [Eggerthellaceae bacterium]|nr:YifB family Mg chelatase-like AAA ATPase [Eggerthellaceae bacterium]
MYGRCALLSATLRGVEAVPVSVEVSVTTGLPGISIVGMPDTAVQESRERVRSAIKAAGFSMPADKVVINLAPADLRKSGSGYDLPIALGMLIATRQVPLEPFEDKIIVGELSLEGAVRPVSGMLAYGMCARGFGYDLLCASGSDRVPVEDFRQYELSSLSRLRCLHDEDGLPSGECCFELNKSTKVSDLVVSRLDYADVRGHEVAKRALQIAAAGGHGFLMMGPPGSGKTMLASRLGSILPPLTQDEALEAAVVHSVAGEDVSSILGGARPFRSPHHSATMAGLVGGGRPVRPGEISLAHNGILFLDELSEFSSAVLQSIRQPMESGSVSLTRADGSILFPARFVLIAASNPCPCGYFGDETHSCECTHTQIRAYQARIGGPLIDRIDLHMDIRRIPPHEVVQGRPGKSSAELREGVLMAREFADWR